MGSIVMMHMMAKNRPDYVQAGENDYVIALSILALLALVFGFIVSKAERPRSS